MQIRRYVRDSFADLIAYRVPATSLSLSISFVAAFYGIWAGVTILCSGPERFSNPVYRIMDSHPKVWGVIVLGFGLLILRGLVRRKFLCKAVGLLGLSAWSLIFAIASARAVFTNPAAATTATPVYAFVSVTLAVLVWMDEKRLTYATANTRER